MTEIRVAELNVYPIKSCGPVQADVVQFSELGIQHDREYMLIGNRGQFVSQRTHPELALVNTAIEREFLRTTLNVDAPGMGQLALDLESFDCYENPEEEIDLFKRTGLAREASEEASSYFSDYLRKEVRLMTLTGVRTIKPECQVEGAATQTGFADGFPILITASESLADLNGKMERPIAMSRFRANIVLEGAPAYDEDYWREIKIGDLQAFVVRACARCPIPNVDQALGELPRQRAVTEALRSHRSGIDPVNDSKGEFFGQNVTHVFRDGLTLAVGEEVEVLTRSSERNFRPTT